MELSVEAQFTDLTACQMISIGMGLKTSGNLMLNARAMVYVAYRFPEKPIRNDPLKLTFLRNFAMLSRLFHNRFSPRQVL